MSDLLKTEIVQDYLAHHGILGQRWGVRRYQNKDGSLTSQGKKRYQLSEVLDEKPAKARKIPGMVAIDEKPAKARKMPGLESGLPTRRKGQKAVEKYKNKSAVELTTKQKAIQAGIAALTVTLMMATVNAGDKSIYGDYWR